MVPRSIHLAVALVLVTSLASALTRTNGIVAVVNGKPITQSELNDTVMAQRQMIFMKYQNNPDELQKELKALESAALDNLIDRELILAEFTKVGGTIKPQFVEDDINGLIRDQFKGNRELFISELAKSGMTMKKFRELRQKMMIVQVMRNQKAARRLPATPKEVEEFYRKNIDRYRDKDMLKISTITIPKFTGEAGSTPEAQKAVAEEIRTKIKAGADFKATAKAYSQDSRAENGGEWDWMERKLMDKTIADAAFKLADGDVGSVVSTDTAYVIIYLEAKKPGVAAPLDKVRPEIEKLIEAHSSQESLKAWLEGLRKKATIRLVNN